ncbi:hypothetical protein [Segatella sp.]|jgi:hypothetical protein|uniref:hypothetical protein n=1 Tax=Segatella sp. TaxID=2974253 RepID=UPI003AADB3C9
MAREEGTENLREVLEQTILEEDNKLFDEKIGDERNAIADNLVSFYKLKLEEDKLAQERDIKMKEFDHKERELDIRARELEQSKTNSKLELIKSGVTLAAWAGLSIGVMVFEGNGGAILSKAFPGIFPKTKI